MRRSVTALAIGAALLFAGTAAADTGLASPYGASIPAPALPNFGGPVQHDPIVHLVFWGSYWQPSDPQVQAEEALFNQLRGSSWGSLLGQYGVNDDARLSGVTFVPSFPNHYVGYEGITRLVYRLSHHHSNRNAQWMIVPEPGARLSARFDHECAEHDYFTYRRRSYAVGIIRPVFGPAMANSCVYDYSTDNGQVQSASPTAALTSVTSHEFAEMATDPEPGGGTAWAADTVADVEIADLCYFYSGTPAGMTVNVSYLWSNALQSSHDGCVI